MTFTKRRILGGLYKSKLNKKLYSLESFDVIAHFYPGAQDLGPRIASSSITTDLVHRTCFDLNENIIFLLNKFLLRGSGNQKTKKGQNYFGPGNKPS